MAEQVRVNRLRHTGLLAVALTNLLEFNPELLPALLRFRVEYLFPPLTHLAIVRWKISVRCRYSPASALARSGKRQLAGQECIRGQPCMRCRSGDDRACLFPRWLPGCSLRQMLTPSLRHS